MPTTRRRARVVTSMEWSRRWVYRSVDDPNEVMMVAEFRTREGAESLLTDPDGMRRWYERTGLEVFPPVLDH